MSDDAAVNLDGFVGLGEIVGGVGEDLGLQAECLGVVRMEFEIAVEIAEGEVPLLLFDPRFRLGEIASSGGRIPIVLECEKGTGEHDHRGSQENEGRGFKRRLRRIFGALLTASILSMSSVQVRSR